MRILDDDTLVVFVSDCHIGGDHGRDIFESADDLTALLDDLGRRTGPVELVLAGDFFDCLRISAVPDGQTRTGVTIARPEYRSLFAALKRFAAGSSRMVTYLPGNHDAEVWWNEAIRDELKRAGLVHAFALSWAAAFKSDPLAIIYCEHGNEFDPANLKRDYRDPYDTPFGDHIVTDVIPRLPHGRAAEAMQLHDIERVFPLDTIPNWIASKLFYTLVTETVRWLLLPLTIAFVAYELISFAIGTGVRAVQTLLVDVAYDIAVVVVAASVFFFVARTIATRSMRASPPALNEADAIRTRLESGAPPPLADSFPGDIAVFVSGHTHAPSLDTFNRKGGRGVVVNSGCWLRQLQPTRAHFRAPVVFAGRFVQTHVRVERSAGTIGVELWERPRPATQRLRMVERMAIAGRLPPTPPPGEGQRIVASATVEPPR